MDYYRLKGDELKRWLEFKDKNNFILNNSKLSRECKLDLRDANLENTDLSYIDLRNAILINSNLSEATLRDVKF